MRVKSKMDAPITAPRAATPRRGSPEWQRRAEAWAAAHARAALAPEAEAILAAVTGRRPE